MSRFMETILLLAQDAEPVAEPVKEAAKNEFHPIQLFPFIAIAFLWYFILYLPQKKQKTKRDDFMQSLKKNDQVITIGGILGTVVNLSEEEVTLRVDDNTRIKMLRSSIQSIKTESSKQENK